MKKITSGHFDHFSDSSISNSLTLIIKKYMILFLKELTGSSSSRDFYASIYKKN